jgi:hypothetical protein
MLTKITYPDRASKYDVPAVGKCLCGRTMECYSGDNQCECGRWYNSSGQELRDPDQWEEPIDED